MIFCSPWWGGESYAGCNLFSYLKWKVKADGPVDGCNGVELSSGIPKWIIPQMVMFPINLLIGIFAFTRWKVIEREDFDDNEKIKSFETPKLEEPKAESGNKPSEDLRKGAAAFCRKQIFWCCITLPHVLLFSLLRQHCCCGTRDWRGNWLHRLLFSHDLPSHSDVPAYLFASPTPLIRRPRLDCAF